MPKKDLKEEDLRQLFEGMAETAGRILKLPPSKGTGVYICVPGPDGAPVDVEVPEDCLGSKEKLLAFIEACHAPKTKA